MSSALQHLYGVLEEHWKGVNSLSESALSSTTSIQAAMSVLARPLQCIQTLRCLEKMRVCVELFCYLLFENFHASADQQATANDDSLLSAYALHFVQTEPQSVEKLVAVGQLMSTVLFTQSDFIYRCSSGTETDRVQISLPNYSLTHLHPAAAAAIIYVSSFSVPAGVSSVDAERVPVLRAVRPHIHGPRAGPVQRTAWTTDLGCYCSYCRGLAAASLVWYVPGCFCRWLF